MAAITRSILRGRLHFLQTAGASVLSDFVETRSGTSQTSLDCHSERIRIMLLMNFPFPPPPCFQISPPQRSPRVFWSPLAFSLQFRMCHTVPVYGLVVLVLILHSLLNQWLLPVSPQVAHLSFVIIESSLKERTPQAL